MGYVPFYMVTLVVALITLQILQEPVPDGASKPYALKWILFKSRIFLDYLPRLSEALGVKSALESLRSVYDRKQAWEAPGVQTSNLLFNGVPVRVFAPAQIPKSTEIFPGVLFIHGGGFSVGNTDSHNHVTSRLSHDLGAVVVSVDYRRTPEYSYQEALDDVVSAYQYFSANTEQFMVDRTKIAIMGDSAGGTMTAALSLKLRDAKFDPQPKLQIMIYPMLQTIDLNMPSYQQNPESSLLTRNLHAWLVSTFIFGNGSYSHYFLTNTHVIKSVREKYAKTYLSHGNIPSEYLYTPYQDEQQIQDGEDSVWNRVKDFSMHPYLSPLLVDDLEGLPPAVMYVGKYDILRDENILYSQRLKESGVEVYLIVDPLGWHPTFSFGLHDPDCERAVAHIIAAVKERL